MIHPTAIIEGGAVIGERCSIGAHSYIAACVVIGDDVQIGPGAVIGCDGFGYEHNDDGTWTLREHTYQVVIENDVHVGANTVIDRGSWRDTTLRSGCRIDNLCHIGHNCIVGERTMMPPGVVLGGSTVIGADCWIGMNATTRERITIGDNATLGMSAALLTDQPAGETWAGVPASMLYPAPTVDEPAPEPTVEPAVVEDPPVDPVADPVIEEAAA